MTDQLDIVDRLRLPVVVFKADQFDYELVRSDGRRCHARDGYEVSHVYELHREAANEIERLRAEVKELEEAVEGDMSVGGISND